jgi:hypothetical protein
MAGFDSLIGPAGNSAGWKGKRRTILQAVADATVLGAYLGGVEDAISEAIGAKDTFFGDDMKNPLPVEVLDDLKNSFSFVFRDSRDSDLRGKYNTLMSILNSCVEVDRPVHVSVYADAMKHLMEYRTAAESCLSLEAGGSGWPREMKDLNSERTKEKEREGERPEEDRR